MFTKAKWAIYRNDELEESQTRVANIYYYEFPKVYCLFKIYYNVQGSVLIEPTLFIKDKH